MRTPLLGDNCPPDQHGISPGRNETETFNIHVPVPASIIIGSILSPLVRKFFEDTRKKGKGAKTGASHDWRSFYLSQYDWLKGNPNKGLPNVTNYSYCEFVAPNTPY